MNLNQKPYGEIGKKSVFFLTNLSLFCVSSNRFNTTLERFNQIENEIFKSKK